MANRTRVMLAHVRMKLDGWLALSEDQRRASKTHTPELQELYSMMTKYATDEPAARKRHPLFAFRPPDDDDSVDLGGDDVDDEVTEILAYLEPHDRQAVILFSDGSKIQATKYVKGPNGFAIAEFKGSSTTLELEIANAHVLDGKLTSPIIQMKRPATADKNQKPRKRKR